MLASLVMKRLELLKQLAEVERQVLDDTELIERQRKILDELDGKGVDTDALQVMLTGLEQLLIFHLQQRESLRTELATLEEPSQGPQSSDR